MALQRITNRARYSSIDRQRGVVMFIAIVALVILMLAAVALVRSVNTSTIIAGNLAMKQSATTSGDRGLTDAAVELSDIYNANLALDASLDSAHPYNVLDVANGYYPTVGTINLTDSTPWGLITAPVVVDASGNSIQYIVERLCRPGAGVVLQTTANCLFDIAEAVIPEIPPEPNIGLLLSGSRPMFRITSRITGAKSTLSYVQSIYY